MGVYIPNMEKPKSCNECRYKMRTMNETFCNLLDKMLGDEDIRPDCPLIEIDPYNWANDLVFVVAEIEKARERLYKVSKIECERKRNDSNT